MATVTSVESLQRRGITWYYVAAQWYDPQTNTAYTFDSQGTPQALHYRKGESITVLIDPGNAQRYFIGLA